MQGAFHHLMKEVRLCGTSRYRNLVRMDVVTFEELLPSTEQEWLSIAEEFLDKWSFKNGIGVMDKRLNIPKETMLPGTKLNFPFVVVADDTFPLKEYIVKPYSQTDLTRDRRIFNYHLRCAHRAVEILLAFWLIGFVFS